MDNIQIIYEIFDELWAIEVAQLRYRFPAKRIKGKFYTLNGKIEIMDSAYIKYAEFDALEDIEKRFVIWNYHKMSEQLEKIGEVCSQSQ